MRLLCNVLYTLTAQRDKDSRNIGVIHWLPSIHQNTSLLSAQLWATTPDTHVLFCWTSSRPNANTEKVAGCWTEPRPTNRSACVVCTKELTRHCVDVWGFGMYSHKHMQTHMNGMYRDSLRGWSVASVERWRGVCTRYDAHRMATDVEDEDAHVVGIPMRILNERGENSWCMRIGSLESPFPCIPIRQNGTRIRSIFH